MYIFAVCDEVFKQDPYNFTIKAFAYTAGEHVIVIAI
jgi:hypothetical protein